MQTHLVDFLLAQNQYPQNICTRTWFRGTADAGEHIVDGMDSTTDYRLFRFMVVIRNQR
jgi:hypothetical protein